MSQEDFIREFNGQIIGIIKTEDNGDQMAMDFPGRRILGFYRKKYDHTTDFYGRITSRGNTVVSLIYKAKAGM